MHHASAARIRELASLIVVLAGSFAWGSEIRLKNEFSIEGKESPVGLQSVTPNRKVETGGNNDVSPLTMIDAGMVRYFVSTVRIAEINRGELLGKYDVFRLKQQLGNRNRAVSQIGIPLKVTEFNEAGLRTVTLRSERGVTDIKQLITEIGPKYCKVSAVDLLWDFSVATTSIRPERLDQLIRKVTDQSKIEDRLTIARFYVQANRYFEALDELEKTAKDFPEKAALVNGFALEARQQLAAQLIEELAHRRACGQHRLAYEMAKKFPTNDISAANLRNLRDFTDGYDHAIEEGERIFALLGELQGQIPDVTQRETLEAMRAEVREQLSYETLPRMKPFLVRADDATSKPDEKLALAYSGWLLGEAKAVDGLSKVLSMWKARFLILTVLREPDLQKRTQALADLLKLEGIGPETVVALLPQLPALLDSPEVKPGEPAIVDVDLAHAELRSDTSSIRYHVMLPKEYSPHHSYPVVITLWPIERGGDGITPQWSLRWWGGNANEPLQAQRHGYIVIAPEYVPNDTRSYAPNALSHFAVLQSLRDARKRFNINSDRVYLSGHGAGGDAAFDIGLAHPDEFAGVIPITGVVPKLTKHLDKNAKLTSLYIVTGELDRNSFEANARLIDTLLISGTDTILAEYQGRGYESYYGEIHKLFSWMELHRRPPLPKEFFVESMRPNDNRFFWLKGLTLPNETRPSASSRVPIKPPPKAPPRPIVAQEKPTVFQASIREGSEKYNELRIVTSPAKQHVVWLTPEMLSFEKRLHVWDGATRKFNDFIAPNTEAILEDFRSRADRQRIFQMKLELN